MPFWWLGNLVPLLVGLPVVTLFLDLRRTLEIRK